MNNGSENPTSPTNLGIMIRKWRLWSERHLRDLAKEIGIGHTTLQRIEKGETFDADTWLKLQNWLFKKNGETLNNKPDSDQGSLNPFRD